MHRNAERQPSSSGPFINFNTGQIRRDNVLVQKTPAAQFYIGFGSREVLLERLAKAEALLRAGFDPDQDRDDKGRWTEGGGLDSEGVDQPNISHSASGNPFKAVMLGGVAASGGLLAEASPVALAAAAEFLIPLAAIGGVVVLGYLAFRWYQDRPVSGSVMGRQDVGYEYDPKDGSIVLSGAGGSPIFSGIVDQDNFIRDPGGVEVGRRLDGVIIMDTAILPDANEDTQATVNAQARAEEDSEPQLCPDPTPDRKGWKSDRAIAYQNYINTLVNPDDPLLPGLAVRLLNPVTGRFVTFDDCYRQFGGMVEAKGPGYGAMLDKNNAKLTAGIDAYLLKQAQRQIWSAGDRPLEWDFADKSAADHARTLFDSAYPGRVNVRYIPMPFSQPSS
jgi:hypothetical protein